MWLDMYAEERHYISRHSKNKTLIEEIWDKNYELLANRWFNCIFKQSMYWRKAYWIHEYFVRNLEIWEDYIFISECVMKDLFDRIEKILSVYKEWGDKWVEVAEETLPILEYWVEYEEWRDDENEPYYIETLKDTKEWLIEALKDIDNVDYYYSSSR